MAQKTLLEIIQTACNELGLAAPSTVVGNTDQTTVQMYAYANQEIEELRQRHNWSYLRKEYNLLISVPITTTGDTSDNSAVITNIPSTAGIVPNANYWVVAGDNIPAAARVLSVDSSTQITMTMECTEGTTGGDLIFSQDTYAEPSDFDHFENRTWWDRTNRWELLGPDSPQIDQWHRSGIVTTGPRRHFIQQGSLPYNYRIWPPPGSDVTAPIQLVYDYISFYSVYPLGVTTGGAKYFTDDSDIPILNDRAIIMGIKWRFWEQKGFDWTMKRTDYDKYVDRLIARDGGAKTLNLVTRINPLFISPANVQDGFFPGPTGPNMS